MNRTLNSPSARGFIVESWDDPRMLRGIATDEGISVPPDLDAYSPNEFPHWDRFVKFQLSRKFTSMITPYRNARVIARIPADSVRGYGDEDLREAGCSWYEISSVEG